VADDLPHFRAFVLGRPCQAQPCIMPPQFHHAQHGETFVPWARPPKALGGKRGKSQRASDWYGLGLCFACHGDFHDLKGKFRDFTNETGRVWMDERIAENQRAYAMAHPDMIGAPVRERRRAPKLRERQSKSGEAERERRRIAAWLRDRAGSRHLKVNEAAVLTDAASELETMGGEF
jgi:hypothetical protein